MHFIQHSVSLATNGSSLLNSKHFFDDLSTSVPICIAESSADLTQPDPCVKIFRRLSFKSAQLSTAERWVLHPTDVFGRKVLVSWRGQWKLKGLVKYLHTHVQRHLGTAESCLLRVLVWVGRECLSRGLNPVSISQLTAPISRLSSTLGLFGQPLLSHILVVHGSPPSQAV